tara:strand:- start:2833 stop:3003 length:171 start_codon:yes stop_codon:yes gene_type:complete
VQRYESSPEITGFWQIIEGMVPFSVAFALIFACEMPFESSEQTSIIEPNSTVGIIE